MWHGKKELTMYHLSHEKMPIGKILNQRPDKLTDDTFHGWIVDDESITGVFATDHQHIHAWRAWMNLTGLTTYVYKVEPLGEVVKIELDNVRVEGDLKKQPPEWFIIGGAKITELYKIIKPEQYPDGVFYNPLL